MGCETIKKELLNKTTMEIYRKCKVEVREEKWIRNGYKFEIMNKVRSNTIKLQWREKEEKEKICKLCKLEKETLHHFLIDCVVLQDIRNECIEMQRPRVENELDVIKKLLLFEKSNSYPTMYYIDLVFKMYEGRHKILEIIK